MTEKHMKNKYPASLPNLENSDQDYTEGVGM